MRSCACSSTITSWPPFPCSPSLSALPLYSPQGKEKHPPGQPDPSGRFPRPERQSYPIRWAALDGRSRLPPSRSSAPAGILLSACASLLFREFLSSLSGAEGGIKGIKDQTCDSARDAQGRRGRGDAGGDHRTPGSGPVAGSRFRSKSRAPGGSLERRRLRSRSSSFLLWGARTLHQERRNNRRGSAAPPALPSQGVTSARCHL